MKQQVIILLLMVLCLPIAAQQKAPLFDMQTRTGDSVSLEDVETPYALLYFNNPDCDVCEEVSDSLSSQDVMQYVDMQVLTVYSVCVAGDFDEWLSQGDRLGRTDVLNRSMSIMAGDDYKFDALPALFLIDRKRNILLNNAPLSQILEYLGKNNR